MGFSKVPQSRAFNAALLLLLVVSESRSATLQDIFNLNTAALNRIPRDTQFLLNRYGAVSPGQTVSSRPIKPEDAPEARERENANVEKRCIRCDYYNNRDYRYPSDYKGRYDDRYDDRDRYRDRYDDRYRDRYYDDYYDRRYYETDRRYNDYDRRYDDRDRNDRYDRYDRYDRDRYDDRRRPQYYENSDRDRYDRDRYDNKNYDRNDRGNSYRPWDETTRGSSGFDSNGRGYYFAVGRPEYSSYGYGSGSGSASGSGSGSGYASNWNYGGRNDSRDRWREQGFSSGSYRPRDQYEPSYYNRDRGTSYLYGRPSSTTTTQSPSPSGGSTVTDNPQTQGNTSSG